MSGTIFMTGASSGIGAATAKKFLDEGWQVGLFARRRAALESVADGAHNAHILPGDITDAAAVDHAVERFVSNAGRLDVLFNNAGMLAPLGSIDEISVSDWQACMDVNLTGMFLAARAAFGQMRRQDPGGGRIINNGSISAYMPREGAAPYTATKHGVTGLTRQISLDGRPFDIACGQIDIGNARTEILQQVTDKAIADGQAPPDTIEVEHVADAVWQMANLPLHANVQFMTLMATKMPYIGRG
ncbi:NADP-dependent 3-hydroxy acid dehydrogenase YdfG [Aliiruegeria haliotis]|uniref:NADP-dependent 3-hydroxy acid dehydrogenase YdfG n=1 Tax=Aliiruegeria haliotis TaxID=1280846 RepID=A0A2T0RL15_9RHOB|nr:SDR family oxidoreductase [Aliiruegeria haliotis]PRY21827.1 NADP-dependent 3-hydroxy acid dehydrogenase YdfG [Aliiruegeria haliotis]